MLENGHIPYYLLTAIPLQQAEYLYRKKKKRDGLSFKELYKQQWLSASLSFIIHRGSLHN